MSAEILDLVDRKELDAPAPVSTRLESVVEALTRKMEDGGLPPGAPLRVSRLSKELDVATNTVREAISILTVQHLVEARAHKSSVVATPTEGWLAAVVAECSGLSILAATLGIARATPGEREEFRAAAEQAMTAWRAPHVEHRVASGLTWNLFQMLASFSRNRYLEAMHAAKRPALVFGFTHLARDRNAAMVGTAIEALRDAVDDAAAHEGAEIVDDLYIYVLDDLILN
ncbi:GntR family transcriptional regulator [Microbacterium sp. NPDC091662]|uniref:GntR family transcriptional regulator n=1 Tax=Microbacterium sp. NPDC091662 TaxID=3364211 RepID=UPI00382C883D